MIMRKTKTLLIGCAFSLLALAPAAQAGRGSNPGAIKQAIASGSADAIAAELERSENLVCPGCVAMVTPLLDNDDARVRQVAAWWLGRRRASELFVDMVNRLAQPDSRRARNAADALGELRMDKAIAPLGAALGNPTYDAEARAAMARALGTIGAPAGWPHLVAATRDSEPAVRAAALAAARGLRGFDDATVAKGLLSDPSAQVRLQAVYTIGHLRSRALTSAGAGVVDALAKLVGTDAEAEVRKRAAWALGEISAPAALASSALQAAASGDSDPLVRSVANAALTRLRN